MALSVERSRDIELRIIGSTTTPFPVGQESIVTNLHNFVYGMIEDRATGRCAGMGKRPGGDCSSGL